MVLDFDGKMLFAALPGKSLRERPRFQHAFHFQAEVVMQPARSMLLNDESRRTFDLFWRGFACRLAGLFEIAFAFVFGQRHRTQINHGLPEWARGCEAARRDERVFSKFGVRRGERRYNKLRFARQRLADEVPDEATNDDVLAQFGNLGSQQVANCHIGIFDEALLEQANGAIEFLEFALDNFVRNVRRLALYLCLVDFAFRLDQVARNIGCG